MKQQNIIVKNYFTEKTFSQLESRKEMKTKSRSWKGGLEDGRRRFYFNSELGISFRE